MGIGEPTGGVAADRGERFQPSGVGLGRDVPHGGGATEVLEDHAHAATVRAFFGMNRKADGLKWPAVKVFWIRVVLALDSHRPKSEAEFWRQAAQVTGEQVRLFGRHPG